MALTPIKRQCSKLPIVRLLDNRLGFVGHKLRSMPSLMSASRRVIPRIKVFLGHIV